MDYAESEAVFDSVGLNPQLFLNEVLNTVDDLVDDAFNYYLQQASTKLRIEGTDRSQHLTKGVGLLHKMIQSVLDKRLAMWEEYCLAHCFQVPEGFSLRKNDDLLVDSSACQDALCSPDLDAQLDSLRSKLDEVGKESVALNRELQALEHQSTSNGNFAALVTEAVQLYEPDSFQGMFQEMTRTALELHTKMGKLKTRRMEEGKRIKTERIFAPKKDLSLINDTTGISDEKLEDLQEFIGTLKNM
ncbi:hypothetical protein FNV43_RR20701 [Rhamnella rubrinervis]|uniref:Protein MIS12 homolog n=1 Tax=Rhamnella rubrinervis TaxID=2594499 RepID=A0A8K0DVB4_9ROSA|nr:hypothetical protein FNV43_RR20701 [Rhamnella rubrinervis]